MRIFQTWKCNIEKEIEILKRQLNVLDGLSTNYKKSVSEIIRNVQRHKDNALVKYSRLFDKVSIKPSAFQVRGSEIEDAYDKVSPQFSKSIKHAIKNVKKYQEHIRIRNVRPLKAGGVTLDTIYTPIDSVGVYVPGGSASYPSTVLMNVIPAKVAGVKKIIMVSPPAKDGAIPPERLVTANECGVNEIYKVGGAHAIAALAFGTETIPKVDKIVGPGNIFVTLAKKEIFGYAGIDMLAGPSEVLIIADAHVNPSFVASDLLSQAEHSPGISILVTCSESLATKVNKELIKQLRGIKRCADTKKYLDKYGVIIVTKGIEACIEITNTLAPEHLQIMTQKPRTVLSKIKHAGAIFLGAYTPVAVGDYIAGPSHVLPTSGTAHFSSGLSVNDFLKRSSVITFSKRALKNVYKDLVEISRVEGLDAHTKSVQIRLDGI